MAALVRDALALPPLLAGVRLGGAWQASCCPQAPPFPGSWFQGLRLLPLVGTPPCPFSLGTLTKGTPGRMAVDGGHTGPPAEPGSQGVAGVRPVASGAPSPSQASEICPEHSQGSRAVTAVPGEMMKYLFYFHLYIQILIK